ncbi:hypothetical protein CAOG_04251 [Capsaspora owczarzaki ATCC 30864]|uniref:Uncharacterized protein n=1 Tax=Capsaspora owczarzaki (strain ATCC 30864) TaxID=595528 RepID=A0A0D2WQV5_CAPO3|nr:hypothetical protein CAOG_04251 [Capsaspora owczarzaki ATCC 30864]KJE93463.1 hypothetical protein CAOG_004251 [Capsaspora owczarzaki ATCC 30864]|eukprot:XP_004348076.1 hypothetical protein CAOG_04251 [Capsaspora owczarzaki ATCC 30864]
MDALLSEHKRLSTKQKQTTLKTLQHLDNVIKQLEQAKSLMLVDPNPGAGSDAMMMETSDSATPTPTLTTTNAAPVPSESREQIVKSFVFKAKSVKEACDKVTEEHRDMHATVSRFGKTIDKAFVTDIDKFANPAAFEGAQAALLNEVIAKHLLRQGHFAAAETFIRESGLTLEQPQLGPFIEMYNIMEAFKQQDLAPALRWASENRQALERIGSSLEFKLHKLEFLRRLQIDRRDALQYARVQFVPFSHSHLNEVQRLMGCLLYYGRAPPTPYMELVDSIHWTEIAHAFTRDCCAMLGMTYDSPLFVSFLAGCAALPTLLKMASVMQGRGASSTLWTSKDELPVEIELGKDSQFHSVFACPVSREQASPENPPMMMKCGHVVCKLSLERLSKNGGRFKCPYCPVEQTPADAHIVHF